LHFDTTSYISNFRWKCCLLVEHVMITFNSNASDIKLEEEITNKYDENKTKCFTDTLLTLDAEKID